MELVRKIHGGREQLTPDWRGGQRDVLAIERDLDRHGPDDRGIFSDGLENGYHTTRTAEEALFASVWRAWLARGRDWR